MATAGGFVPDPVPDQTQKDQCGCLGDKKGAGCQCNSCKDGNSELCTCSALGAGKDKKSGCTCSSDCTKCNCKGDCSCNPCKC